MIRVCIFRVLEEYQRTGRQRSGLGIEGENLQERRTRIATSGPS